MAKIAVNYSASQMIVFATNFYLKQRFPDLKTRVEVHKNPQSMVSFLRILVWSRDGTDATVFTQSVGDDNGEPCVDTFMLTSETEATLMLLSGS